MAQRSTPGTLSVPVNEDLRQRLNTRAAEINKPVNDCVEEAVEHWLEVTEDDPRAGAPTGGTGGDRSGSRPRLHAG